MVSYFQERQAKQAWICAARPPDAFSLPCLRFASPKVHITLRSFSPFTDYPIILFVNVQRGPFSTQINSGVASPRMRIWVAPKMNFEKIQWITGRLYASLPQFQITCNDHVQKQYRYCWCAKIEAGTHWNSNWFSAKTDPKMDEGRTIFPIRYLIAVLGHCGILVAYAMRVNLSVGLVAMVNSTYVQEISHEKMDPECQRGHSNITTSSKVIIYWWPLMLSIQR